MAEEPTGVPSPQHQPQDEAAGPPPKHPRPHKAQSERTWASWRELGPSGAAPPIPPQLRASVCLLGTATGSSRERKGAVCLPQSWHHQQAAGVAPPTPQAAWR